MPWKLARVALALCAVVLAGARADDEKPKEKPKLPAEVQKCVDACRECIKACQAAGKHSTEKAKDGEKKYVPALRWIYDCAQTCVLAGQIVGRQGPGHLIACDACAKMCDGCAKACKGFDDDELKECAKQCAACAKACRDLIKGAKPAKKGDKKAKGGEGEDKKASIELAPPADVTLKPGGEATVTVEVNRKNFDEELAVTFSGLPKGVAVKGADLKIKKGASSGKFRLRADKERVKNGDQVVKVTVRGGDGKLEVSNTFKVTIKAED
jgi:hypothetical protein